jgi:hypothetical protein
MNFLKKLALTFGPRLLGVAASAIAGLIVTKTKGVVQIDPTTMVEVGTAMIGAYAASHRAATAVSSNPGDAATDRVAEGLNRAANDETVDTVVRIPDR